jgi:hypothetical protein
MLTDITRIDQTSETKSKRQTKIPNELYDIYCTM